ncbi:MAG: glycosyl hydrolase family 28 protein [Kofleriaceae bacterium]
MKALVLVVLAACATKGGAPNPESPDAMQGKSDGSGSGGDDTGTYIRYEKFNAMTTGAAPTGFDGQYGNVGVIREVPFAQDKSVELATPATLSTTFGAQHGRIVFEAKVLARETAGFKAIPYVYDASGAAVASIAFQDGNLVQHVGDATQIVMPFVPNTWYRVRLVVDTDRDVFDLFVDGVRKSHDLALRAATDAVTRVAYYTDSQPAGTLVVDNVKIYNEATFIGAAPQPVFDARDYGAVGDGTTNDTAAIQRAIDAAKGTGGSVVLQGGTFLSGGLSLGSQMTFYVAASATLLGSTNPADYPDEVPNTGNTQLLNCKRALLYANGVDHVRIDGGGTLDGQGDAFSGAEGTRPILIWAVLSQNVVVRNLYLKKGAVWSLVSMESDHVQIGNVNVQSDNITHDGIDIVDGSDVVVDEVAVKSGDDAMCIKSGVRRGVDGLTVKNGMFGGSGPNGGSNGIKFGTATYGAFTHIAIEDSVVKDVQYAAMAVESRQGSDIDGVAFSRIEMTHVGAAFFVYLAQQATTHPIGDTPKLGSITNVSFTDIAGATAFWNASPHQGSLITGHIYNGVTYPITNLTFTNVHLTFDGGLATIPATPPEAMPDQYPESNMFGDLPAWGYYMRHTQNVTFTNCTAAVATTDARPERVTDN